MVDPFAQAIPANQTTSQQSVKSTDVFGGTAEAFDAIAHESLEPIDVPSNVTSISTIDSVPDVVDIISTPPQTSYDFMDTTDPFLEDSLDVVAPSAQPSTVSDIPISDAIHSEQLQDDIVDPFLRDDMSTTHAITMDDPFASSDEVLSVVPEPSMVAEVEDIVVPSIPVAEPMYHSEYDLVEEATQEEATQEEATQEEATQEEATQEEATQEEATQEEVIQEEATQEEAIQEDIHSVADSIRDIPEQIAPSVAEVEESVVSGDKVTAINQPVVEEEKEEEPEEQLSSLAAKCLVLWDLIQEVHALDDRFSDTFTILGAHNPTVHTDYTISSLYGDDRVITIFKQDQHVGNETLDTHTVQFVIRMGSLYVYVDDILLYDEHQEDVDASIVMSVHDKVNKFTFLVEQFLKDAQKGLV